MIFRSGWLHLGSFGDVPLRVHWTLPVGAFLLTGASWVPGAWVGFGMLILAHEIGHAVLVRASGFRVVAIELHGIGGECQWVGNASERQRAGIAWGGVLAQLAILLTTPLWGSRIPAPLPPFVGQLIYAFTATNMVMILLNLLPVAPLDGATAWKILRLVLPSWRSVELRFRARSIRRELDAMRAPDDDDDDDPPESPRGKTLPLRPGERDRSKLN